MDGKIHIYYYDASKLETSCGFGYKIHRWYVTVWHVHGCNYNYGVLYEHHKMRLDLLCTNAPAVIASSSLPYLMPRPPYQICKGLKAEEISSAKLWTWISSSHLAKKMHTEHWKNKPNKERVTRNIYDKTRCAFKRLRARQDGRHFADIFSRAFSSIIFFLFWLNFHWNISAGSNRQ